MAKADDIVDPFVASLEKLVQDGRRGALAGLRRDLGKPPGTAAEAHRYVAWATSAGGPSWRDDCLYIVASLFACWHQGGGGCVPAPRWNLGGSLRELARKSETRWVQRAWAREYWRAPSRMSDPERT